MTVQPGKDGYIEYEEDVEEEENGEEASQVHTPEHPFCSDPTCDCHEDKWLISEVDDAYQEGEVTAEEATRIVNGQQA